MSRSTYCLTRQIPGGGYTEHELALEWRYSGSSPSTGFDDPGEGWEVDLLACKIGNHDVRHVLTESERDAIDEYIHDIEEDRSV